MKFITRSSVLFAFLVSLAIAGCGGGRFAGVVITVAPNPVQIKAGGTAAVLVTVHSRTHANASLQLTVSGLPTGVTGVFDKPTLAVSDTTAILTLTADATVLPGNFTGITVQATETNNSAAVGTAVLVLHVAQSFGPDFLLSVVPTGQTLTNTVGSSITFSVFITPTNGLSGTVGLSVSNVPAGLTLAGPTPSTVTVPPNGNASFTLTVLATQPAGSFNLNVLATSGETAHATTATIQVN